MDAICKKESKRKNGLIELTRDWGSWRVVSLYLARCQVDTPDILVKATWNHVHQLRSGVGKVVDFGAGDARFAKYGKFKKYIGYEIDPDRKRNVSCLPTASLIHKCAFADEITDADLCIGNPPFVRNQDLPDGWRQRVFSVLKGRTGVEISGLANAWQYFFLLSLVSTKADGLVALVIPYEWVSRPSVRALREYIQQHKWNVSVYRLIDATFDSVLTTASITVVDKSKREGHWQYFEETKKGEYKPLSSPSGAKNGFFPYRKRSDISKIGIRAIRGLSPGTQKILTLTEGERVRSGLVIDRDVVPCVTTLRHLPLEVKQLDEKMFRAHFRTPGNKCWLIRTDRKLSAALQAYLDTVPETAYQTSTCLGREVWWKFRMPSVPGMLMSTSFKGPFPKATQNIIGARAVGSVCGIYNVDEENAERLVLAFKDLDIRDRVVPHANGLRKLEINQLNTLLFDAFLDGS